MRFTPVCTLNSKEPFRLLFCFKDSLIFARRQTTGKFHANFRFLFKNVGFLSFCAGTLIIISYIIFIYAYYFIILADIFLYCMPGQKSILSSPMQIYFYLRSLLFVFSAHVYLFYSLIDFYLYCYSFFLRLILINLC